MVKLHAVCHKAHLMLIQRDVRKHVFNLQKISLVFNLFMIMYLEAILIMYHLHYFFHLKDSMAVNCNLYN